MDLFKSKFNILGMAVGVLALFLSIAAQAQVTIEIEADPDYRYRDVFGVSFGPEEDLDGILEVFLHSSGFDTRTGIEFPTVQADTCDSVLSATLSFETHSDLTFIGGTVDIYGMDANGTPALENVTTLGPYQRSFVPEEIGITMIDMPADFIQSTLNSGAEYLGFTLATAVVDTDWVFRDNSDPVGGGVFLTLECEDATPVPVLNNWLMILLTILAVGGMGFYYKRRFSH